MAQLQQYKNTLFIYGLQIKVHIKTMTCLHLPQCQHQTNIHNHGPGPSSQVVNRYCIVYYSNGFISHFLLNMAIDSLVFHQVSKVEASWFSILLSNMATHSWYAQLKTNVFIKNLCKTFHDSSSCVYILQARRQDNHTLVCSQQSIRQSRSRYQLMWQYFKSLDLFCLNLITLTYDK